MEVKRKYVIQKQNKATKEWKDCGVATEIIIAVGRYEDFVADHMSSKCRLVSVLDEVRP